MPPTARPNPSHKLKLAIIPVLTMVLLWMVFGGEQAEETPPSAAPALPVAPAPLQEVPSRHVSREEIKKPWPDFRLDEIILHDPFTLDGRAPATNQPLASREGTPASGAAETAQQPRLQQEEWPVSVFLDSQASRVALAKDHVLHAGDVIDGKYRVLSLSQESVVVETLP